MPNFVIRKARSHLFRVRSGFPTPSHGGPGSDRFWAVIGLLTLVLSGPARAIDDVPEGTLLWLQGFDGNPPTAGFRVDGTVLLRSVDDIANIGINLSSGAITNSPTGAIRTEVGVTGARFINGSLFNDGLVRLDAVTAFGAAGAVVENRGQFEIGPGARSTFTGKGGVFRQTAGELKVGERNFEFRDGRFEFNGGTITGRPLFVRSTVSFGTPELAFAPELVGPGGRFVGPLSASLHLRVLGAAGLGGDTAVTLEGDGALAGHLEVGSLSGGRVTLTTTAGQLWIQPSGRFTVGNTGGGPTALTGNLRNEGVLQLGGDLTVVNGGQTATNRAALRIPAGRTLRFNGAFQHEAGALELAGGILDAGEGITLNAPVFQATGEVRGGLTNRSVLVLDQAVGGLVARGRWASTGTSELTLVLSEPESSEPMLSVLGVLAPEGSCRVELESGFVPPLGATFPLIRHQGIEGRFSSITLPELPAGTFWNLVRQRFTWELGVQDEPAPCVLTVEAAGRQVTLRLEGTPGKSATLFQSTDLTDWVEVQTATPFNGEFTAGLATVSDASAKRFFRASVTP